MSFAVVWNPIPTGVIDAAWEAAETEAQDKILEALDQLQRLLQDDPQTLGESRQNTVTRVYTAMPVTVHYRIVERLGLVRVFAARVYRPS